MLDIFHELCSGMVGCFASLILFNVIFNAVSGLLVDHQDMHLSSLMIGGMHLTRFMPWMVSMFCSLLGGGVCICSC